MVGGTGLEPVTSSVSGVRGHAVGLAISVNVQVGGLRWPSVAVHASREPVSRRLTFGTWIRD
jgi:hypothetical protein